jgi:hypothetical protein
VVFFIPIIFGIFLLEKQVKKTMNCNSVCLIRDACICDQPSDIKKCRVIGMDYVQKMVDCLNFEWFSMCNAYKLLNHVLYWIKLQNNEPKTMSNHVQNYIF